MYSSVAKINGLMYRAPSSVLGIHSLSIFTSSLNPSNIICGSIVAMQSLSQDLFNRAKLSRGLKRTTFPSASKCAFIPSNTD